MEHMLFIEDFRTIEQHKSDFSEFNLIIFDFVIEKSFEVSEHIFEYNIYKSSIVMVLDGVKEARVIGGQL
jgi:hypothetical protein